MDIEYNNRLCRRVYQAAVESCLRQFLLQLYSLLFDTNSETFTYNLNENNANIENSLN